MILCIAENLREHLVGVDYVHGGGYAVPLREAPIWLVVFQTTLPRICIMGGAERAVKGGHRDLTLLGPSPFC